MEGHLVYSGRSLWPRLHFHSGLYFRNPFYAAIFLLCITAKLHHQLSKLTYDCGHVAPPIINHNIASVGPDCLRITMHLAMIIKIYKCDVSPQ